MTVLKTVVNVNTLLLIMINKHCRSFSLADQQSFRLFLKRMFVLISLGVATWRTRHSKVNVEHYNLNTIDNKDAEYVKFDRCERDILNILLDVT